MEIENTGGKNFGFEKENTKIWFPKFEPSEN